MKTILTCASAQPRPLWSHRILLPPRMVPSGRILRIHHSQFRDCLWLFDFQKHTCDRCVYEPWVDFSTILPTKPHWGQFPRNEVFHKDIWTLNQTVHDFEALRFLEVDSHWAFVPIYSEEIRRFWRKVRSTFGCGVKQRCRRWIPRSYRFVRNTPGSMR